MAGAHCVWREGTAPSVGAERIALGQVFQKHSQSPSGGPHPDLVLGNRDGAIWNGQGVLDRSAGGGPRILAVPAWTREREAILGGWAGGAGEEWYTEQSQAVACTLPSFLILHF